MFLFCRGLACAFLASAGVLLAIQGAAYAQDPFGARDPFSRGPAPTAAESPKRELPRRMSSDDDVAAALEMPITLHINKVSLSHVAQYMADAANINVDIDTRNLEDIGIGSDTPVSFRVDQMRMKSILNHMLPQLGLSYTVRGGAVVITTPEEVEEERVTRVYPVADLAMADPLAGDDPNFDLLIDNVQWMVAPTTWEDVGGVGTIDTGPGSLIINQSYQVHAQIQQFLAATRAAREIAIRHTRAAPPISSVRATDGKDEAIRAALDKEFPLSFIETPLADVAKHLAEATGVNVLIDIRALEDVGIGGDTPITLNVKGVTLAAGLSLMLRALDLMWEIRDDALVITTPEEAEANLHVRLYPVLDLVRLEEIDGPDFDEGANDYDALIDAIVALVRPTTWEEVGGPACIDTVGLGCLAIAQTIDAFEEIDALLASYRQVRSQYREHPQRVFADAVAIDEAKHGKLRRALQQKAAAINVSNAPLGDVVQALAKHHVLPIQIDHRGLEFVGLAAESRITADVGEEPLCNSMRRMLKPHGLTWTLRNEVVLITSKEEAEATLVIKFYPVGDLVEREDDLDDLAFHDREDALLDAIAARVAPQSWEEKGGPGAIETPAGPVLAVVQTEENHESLAAFLADYRETQKQQRSQARGQQTAKPTADATGAALFVKNYELQKVSSEETATLAEIARSLIATSAWDAEQGYSIRPSMTQDTIIVRHTAATHRKIHWLFYELGVYQRRDKGGGFGGGGLGGGLGGGGFGGGLGGGFGGGGLGGGDAEWGRSAVTRIEGLSLSSHDADNPLDEAIVLRILRLDTELEDTPEQLAAEIRRRIEPETWRHAAGVCLHVFRRQLIIRHTPSVQRKIHRLLAGKDALLKPQPQFGGVF